MSICYVTLFLDIGREKWKYFSRTFDDYLKDFYPYINLFDNCNNNSKLVVFIDKKYMSKLESVIKSNIILIGIDNEFMDKNFPMWKTLKREKEIMKSDYYKSLISHRTIYPENNVAEYTLINHCKIDAISYVIKNNITNLEYYAWIDFGYFKNEKLIPKRLININKLDLDCINYTLINKLEEKDKDIEYTLKNAPEKIAGYFFFGRKDKMIEYGKLFRETLEFFQNKLEIADDDQHLALVCYYKNPKLFKLHYLGMWHIALLYFN